jgi:Fe-S cluster biogenesis protein NfuA
MSDLRERVEKMIRDEIAPAMEVDGSVIEVLDIENGCARVRLGGACAACPATIMYFVRGFEEELRQRFPEVEYLEAVP